MVSLNSKHLKGKISRGLRQLGWREIRLISGAPVAEYQDITLEMLQQWVRGGDIIGRPRYIQHVDLDGEFALANYFCQWDQGAYLEPVHGLAVTGPNSYLRESLLWPNSYGFCFPWLVGEWACRLPERRIQGSAVSLRSVFETGGYFHLHVDVLARLMILDQKIDLERVPIVVSGHLRNSSLFRQMARLWRTRLGKI
jgi:hypothetical protein